MTDNQAKIKGATFPNQLIFNFIQNKSFFTWVLVLAIVPKLFLLAWNFSLDDYMQWAMFTDNEILQKEKLILVPESPEWLFKVGNQFNFFDDKQDLVKNLKEFGVVPWWTNDGARLHLFRPVASITHLFDYQVWGKNATPMYLESILFYLISIFILYRCVSYLTDDRALKNLFILFIIADASANFGVAWIASRNVVLAFLFVVSTILFHHRWRSEQNQLFLVLAVVCLLLAVLSAEAGISTIAYLFAYALLLDKASFIKRLFSLVPYGILIVAWRIAYTKFGYGAANIDHYIDPVLDPMLFLSKVVATVPIIIFEQVFVADSIDQGMSLPWIDLTSKLTSLLIVIGALVLFRYVKNSPLSQFGLLGALLAMIPMCAIHHTDGRTMPFICIGFGLIWADFVLRCYRGVMPPTSSLRHFVERASCIFIIFFHVYISLLLSIAVMASHAAVVKTAQSTVVVAGTTYDKPEKYGGKHVVFLSSPRLFFLLHLPYQLAYEGKPLPETMRLLAPYFDAIDVKRLSERKISITPKAGFIISNAMRLPVETGIGRVFGDDFFGRSMNGFFSRGDGDFKERQRIEFPEMVITIIEVDNGRPMAIEIELTDTDLSDYHWLQWDIGTNGYVGMELPEIGETMYIPPYQEELAKVKRERQL